MIVEAIWEQFKIGYFGGNIHTRQNKYLIKLQNAETVNQCD